MIKCFCRAYEIHRKKIEKIKEDFERKKLQKYQVQLSSPSQIKLANGGPSSTLMINQ
jgi:hypothetical protein